MSAYEQDFECDWVSGSFVLVRREALQSAGFMDERFFLFCDENDLCLRIKQAGWEVRHLPDLTIMHHTGKAGWNPKLEAQGAYAKRLYMRKHFSPPHRLAATRGSRARLRPALRCMALGTCAERMCARSPRYSSRSSPASVRGATARRASSRIARVLERSGSSPGRRPGRSRKNRFPAIGIDSLMNSSSRGHPGPPRRCNDVAERSAESLRY